MDISITAMQYDTLRYSLRRAEHEVPYQGIWKALHDHYGYGDRRGRILALSSGEREQMALRVKALTGLDPRHNDRSERKNETRTSVSPGADEKWQTLPPRAPYLEIRYLDDDPSEGYRGVHVEVFLQGELSKVDNIMTIENFDTFVSLTRQQLASVVPKPMAAGTCLVFRGDSVASPKAVTRLLEVAQGRVRHIHFPDFDPAGIVLGVAMRPDGLILPDLTSVDVYREVLRRSDKFNRQRDYYLKAEAFASEYPSLKGHIDYMLRMKVAPQQEPMLNLEVPFQEIALR